MVSAVGAVAGTPRPKRSVIPADTLVHADAESGVASGAMPGVPSALDQAMAVHPIADRSDYKPFTVFREDFEGQGGVKLDSFVRHIPSGNVRYTADQYWLEERACNGFIAGVGFEGYPDYQQKECNRINAALIQAKVRALAPDPQNPGDNHALSTNTDGKFSSRTGGTVMFRTDPSTRIRLPFGGLLSDSRFVNFSVDAAASNADQHPPLLHFNLLQYDERGNERGVVQLNSPVAIDTTGKAVTVKTRYREPGPSGAPVWRENNILVHTKSVYGSRSKLIGLGSRAQWTIGLELVNTEPSPIGNDGAVDNIQILDVTPRVIPSLDTPLHTIGEIGTLTFTVQNRTDGAEKMGWAFTGRLPKGLSVAPGAQPQTNCADQSAATQLRVDRTADGDRIVATDGVMANGVASCTIDVAVTSSTAGVYRIGPDDITDAVGMDRTDDIVRVKFTDGTMSWHKVDAYSGDDLSGSSWTLTRDDQSGPEAENLVFPSGAAVTVDATGKTAAPPASGTWTSAGDGADDGQFTLSGLPWGTYVLRERTPPNHYPANPRTYRFAIVSGTLSPDSPDVTVQGRPLDGTDRISNDKSILAEPIGVAKRIGGRDWKNGDGFRFTLNAESASTDPNAFDAANPTWGTDPSPMPDGTASGAQATVTVACPGGTRDDGCAAVGFGQIRYFDPGTYRYTVAEEVPASGGVADLIYDGKPRTVLVKVGYAANGLLEVQGVKWRADGERDWTVVQSGRADVAFTNTIYVKVSALPLTGGRSGRDWLIGGALLALLAAVGCVPYQLWRRKRLPYRSE